MINWAVRQEGGVSYPEASVFCYWASEFCS